MTQSKMNYYLTKGNEAVFIAINSFKNEIELANWTKNNEDM